MIARWQFWHQGHFILLRHTSNANDSRILCKCESRQIAEDMVSLLDSIRFKTEDIAGMFSKAKEIK